MDTERDPTDLGLSYVPTDEDVEAARAARKAAARRAAEQPSGPPASERVIERERQLHGWPRSRNSVRLRHRCVRCESGAGSWCRRTRLGRPVLGLVHDERDGSDAPE